MNFKTARVPIDPLLLSRCKTGDNTAYKELYGRYAKAMLNISVRILNNTAEAEDVLQESFLKAFQNIGNFENEAAFGGWLKRVVVNRSIDILRKQKDMRLQLDNVSLAENEDEAMDHAAYDIAAVRDGMLELPAGYRVVLTLFLFEDYSHKDIAGILNISEGTSKSQYNRAKKKLMQIIQNKKTIHEQ